MPDPDGPGVGEEIAALLTSDGGTAAREADAFSIPAETHLHPKLRLAVRATKDFRINPETHAAHLSLLFDVFPAEEVAARKADPRHATAFVHGLVQAFSTEYHEDELFRRVPGAAAPGSLFRRRACVLQPEATGAVMEVTKWLKPSV